MQERFLQLKIKSSNIFLLINFDEKLSVRETEKLVKDLKKPKKEKTKKDTSNDFIYRDLEEKMRSVIGTKVSVNQKSKGKGKIEIEYYSDEELEHNI